MSGQPRFLAVLPALLALGLGCERPAARTEVFSAHEEGLTLAYENPSLPPAEMRDARLQVRVAKVAPAPAGGQLLSTTYTTLKGEFSVTTLLKDGGLSLLGPDGQPVATLLPPGFPDRTATWAEGLQRFTVVGRAVLPDLQVELPPGAERMGVWIEGRPSVGTGVVSRTFFLPDIGEVETRELRDGRWVTVKRLVSRGFTQIPSRAFAP